MAKGDVLFEGRMMGMETAYQIVLEAEGEHSPAAWNQRLASSSKCRRNCLIRGRIIMREVR